jgi:hypothetical protein
MASASATASDIKSRRRFIVLAKAWFSGEVFLSRVRPRRMLIGSSLVLPGRLPCMALAMARYGEANPMLAVSLLRFLPLIFAVEQSDRKINKQDRNMRAYT